MSDLAATFDTIINTAQGKAPPPDAVQIPADDAVAELQDTLLRTILPRRITLRGTDGARVSVIAKNRRVVNLSEVHPAANWSGKSAPEETECLADSEDFSGPFASAVAKTIGGNPIHIEQALLTDPLGATKAGYPAGLLVEHVEKSQGKAPAGDQITAFFEANDGLPRARLGSEIEITIPADAPVSHDWMQARIDEAVKELKDVEADIRLLILDGEKPMALALAWCDGEGTIILSDDPETFDGLEQKLGDLRANL